MNGNIFVVETVLNATVHYQYFTPSACRDYHKKIVYFALLPFLPCRDAVFCNVLFLSDLCKSVVDAIFLFSLVFRPNFATSNLRKADAESLRPHDENLRFSGETREIIYTLLII